MRDLHAIVYLQRLLDETFKSMEAKVTFPVTFAKTPQFGKHITGSVHTKSRGIVYS